MKLEMLQIQQYINLHPVLKMNDRLKRKYFVLLNYLVNRQSNRDIWAVQTLNLYREFISSNLIQIEKEKIKDLNCIEKLQFFHYKYFLLTDFLFICAYGDEGKGKEILNSFIKFYRNRNQKKFECVYKAFYSTHDDGFLNKFPELKDIYSVIWNNRLFVSNSVKSVIITANMSAGKSTLL